VIKQFSCAGTAVQLKLIVLTEADVGLKPAGMAGTAVHDGVGGFGFVDAKVCAFTSTEGAEPPKASTASTA